MKIKAWIGYALLLIACLLPLFMAGVDLLIGVLPSDSSVFRYIGWRVSCFDGCYSVAFDHKGPVIFLAHALGYWIAPHSEIGVNLIYTLMWGYVIVSIYRIAANLESGLCGGIVALFFSLVALTNASGCFDDIEITALFFGLVMLNVSSIMSKNEDAPINEWRYFACGVFASLAFMTKANLVSLPGAILLIWLWDAIQSRGYKLLLRQILWSGLGFVLATTALFSVFGFWETWDAAFAYNMFEYRHGVDVGVIQYWIKRISGFKSIWAYWFLAGWIGMFLVGLVSTLFSGRIKNREYLFLTLWMLFETTAAVVFKGFFEHYAILSLAVVSVLFFANIFSLKYKMIRFVFFVSIAMFAFIECKWALGGIKERKEERKVVEDMLVDIGARFPDNPTLAIWGGFNVNQFLADAKRVKPPQQYFLHSSNYNCAGEKRRSEITGELLKAMRSGLAKAVILEPTIKGKAGFIHIVRDDKRLVSEIAENWAEEKRNWGYVLIPKNVEAR